MPPIVAWAEVDTSTGNQSPCGRRNAFNRSSAMPGWTVAVALAASNEITSARCFELSMTSAAPTVCPHCELPAPRGSTGTPASTAIWIARSASASVCGTTTPTGST